MRTERFDELFRKKLEDMPQRYTEEDIDKVFRHVMRHNRPYLKRSIVRFALFGIILTAIAGLLIWNLHLRQNLAETRNPPPSEILVESDSSLNEPLQVPASSISTSAGSENPFDAPSPLPFAAPQQNEPLPHDMPQHPQPEEISDILEFRSSGGSLSNPLISQEFRHYFPMISPGRLDAGTAGRKLARIALTRKILLARIQSGPAPDDRQKNKKSGPGSKISSLHREDSTTKIAFPGRFFSKFRPEARLGATLQLTADAMATGIVMEGLFMEKWSLTTGILYQYGYPETFRDEKEFLDRRRKPFPEAFPGQANSQDRLQNIRTNRNMFKIPVSLAHYFPLSKNIKMIVGIGTSFHLGVTENLRFDKRPPADSLYRPGHSRFGGDPEAFVPLEVMAGLEKKWGRWSVFASPFAGIRLGTPSPGQDDLYGGITIGAKYTVLKPRALLSISKGL